MKRRIRLLTDRAQFGGVVLDRPSRQLLFKWFARTEMRNVIWVCLVVFRLGWPPVRWIEAFTGDDSPPS
ncbi:MAG: hypothetical protein WC749_11975 [Dehalococcoidia bacterium]